MGPSLKRNSKKLVLKGRVGERNLGPISLYKLIFICNKKHVAVDMQSGMISKIAKIKGNCLVAIKKNNMKGKDVDEDRWNSYLRMPYERVFAHRSRRMRYVGIAKNQFAAFMRAICFNLKRLIVLNPPPSGVAT